MPIYSYKCPICDTEFVNYWRVKDYNKDTPCPECEAIAEKQVNRDFVFFSNEKGGFTSGYNHALGREVTTRGQYRKLLKEKGLVEMGNERNANQKMVNRRKGIDDSLLKEAVERGAEITGQEAEALKKGELKHIE